MSFPTSDDTCRPCQSEETCRGQKRVKDFCSMIFGVSSKGFSWRLFLSTLTHKNAEKKPGGTKRETNSAAQKHKSTEICSVKASPNRREAGAVRRTVFMDSQGLRRTMFMDSQNRLVGIPKSYLLIVCHLCCNQERRRRERVRESDR